MNIFNLNFWKYLLKKKSKDYSWFEVIKCRYQGHERGVVWYNTHGYEPDMTCKGCGDDLG